MEYIILILLCCFIIFSIVWLIKIKFHLYLLIILSFIVYNIFPSMWRTEINRLIELRGMKKRYTLFGADFFEDKKIDAGAVFGNVIILSSGLIKNKNNMECVNFLLGHELTHIRYKDGGKKQAKLEHAMRSKENDYKYKATMFHILKEIRADIESAIYSNMTQEEIKQAHKFIERYKEENYTQVTNDKQIYLAGYPPRSERIRYSLLCMKQKEVNSLDINYFKNNIAVPLLTNYCIEANIDNQLAQLLMSEVLDCFEKDCNGLFL